MKKKLGLALILAIVSSGVMAEWQRIGSTDVGITYVDRKTIRTSGKTAKMWELLDYRKIQKFKGVDAYSSAKNQTEYDCKDEKYRTVYFSLHSEKMGGGTVFHTDNDVQNWTPVPPETVLESSWKVACGVQ